MTPKINLLPYRATRRKAIVQRFYAFLAVSAVVGFGAIAVVHTYYGLQISSQTSRNERLEKEIKLLDGQIEEIKKLKEETAAMLSRKQVVESLQANRSRAVMLFNQVVQPPPGIFYKAVSQKKDIVTLNGFAQSNTFVSNLIRQVETSDIFNSPKLVETKKVTVGGAQLIEFTLQAKVIDLAKLAAERQKAAAQAQGKGRGGKPAAGGAPANASAVPATPAK